MKRSNIDSLKERVLCPDFREFLLFLYVCLLLHKAYLCKAGLAHRFLRYHFYTANAYIFDRSHGYYLVVRYRLHFIQQKIFFGSPASIHTQYITLLLASP